MRIKVAMAACAAMLAFGAPTASASLVNRTVYKCELDATWQVTLNFSGTSYADATETTVPGSCRAVNATVQPDGTFSVTNRTFEGAVSVRWNLVGAGITGSPNFAGVATQPDGPGRGTFVIANGSILNATLAGVYPDGEHFVAEVYGTGSCGTNCYRTRIIEEGAFPPGP
ncbi:MAG: hypothetical protein M3340_13250 [Actinomycetota bacterium]|nr:hypothetical protein [Actinomycetota bacterium]